MMDQDRLYRIGELAGLSGVSPRTIDYYTRLGMLQASCRSGGNYRLYGGDSLERLRSIRAYRRQGLHLSAIQDRLGSPHCGCHEAAVWEQLAEIQGLVDQMVLKAAEIAEAKPELKAVVARDQRTRVALSRLAGDVLHRALLLSGLLASTVEEVRRPVA